MLNAASKKQQEVEDRKIDEDEVVEDNFNRSLVASGLVLGVLKERI